MSKPKEPIVGLPVQYIGSDGEPRAAVILAVGAVLTIEVVNLAVFGRGAADYGAGPIFISGVPFSADGHPGTWRWPEKSS